MSDYPSSVQEQAHDALANIWDETERFLAAIRASVADALEVRGGTRVDAELSHLRDVITEHLQEQLSDAYDAACQFAPLGDVARENGTWNREMGL